MHFIINKDEERTSKWHESACVCVAVCKLPGYVLIDAGVAHSGQQKIFIRYSLCLGICRAHFIRAGLTDLKCFRVNECCRVTPEFVEFFLSSTPFVSRGIIVNRCLLINKLSSGSIQRDNGKENKCCQNWLFQHWRLQQLFSLSS